MTVLFLNPFYVQPQTVSVSYTLVAGGGGSGGTSGSLRAGGGGGAGGYLDSSLTVSMGDALALTVGAGGSENNTGNDSIFASLTAKGGGWGGQGATGPGGNGGSGGGGAGGVGATSKGSGTSGQGYDGSGGTLTVSGAGGGATGPASGTMPGIGATSSIDAAAVYATGGSGKSRSTNSAASAGATNTGNGASGRGGSTTGAGASGGSGIILLKIPSGNSATFSAGVSQTSTTSGDFRIYRITAAGVSDTVTFA